MDKKCDTSSLITRFKRMEGQVKGISNMIVDDRPCEDVLTQILALEGALHNVGKIILKNHLNHCVRDSIARGDEEALLSFNSILEKFI